MPLRQWPGAAADSEITRGERNGSTILRNSATQPACGPALRSSGLPEEHAEAVLAGYEVSNSCTNRRPAGDYAAVPWQPVTRFGEGSRNAWPRAIGHSDSARILVLASSPDFPGSSRQFRRESHKATPERDSTGSLFGLLRRGHQQRQSPRSGCSH